MDALRLVSDAGSRLNLTATNQKVSPFRKARAPLRNPGPLLGGSSLIPASVSEPCFGYEIGYKIEGSKRFLVAGM